MSGETRIRIVRRPTAVTLRSQTRCATGLRHPHKWNCRKIIYSIKTFPKNRNDNEAERAGFEPAVPFRGTAV